jgi:hypothetical protein
LFSEKKKQKHFLDSVRVRVIKVVRGMVATDIEGSLRVVQQGETMRAPPHAGGGRGRRGWVIEKKEKTTDERLRDI